MNLINANTTTKKITKLLIITTFIGGQIFNIGCVSLNQREDSISAILIKENELIKKVKIERSQSGISQELKKSVELQKVENHLLLSLDEIHNSNEKIINTILNVKQKEFNRGENKRHVD